MTFSDRTHWDLSENDFAVALRRRRSSGTELIDLTNANPTNCGFLYDESSLLAPLATPEAQIYQPDSLGMLPARQAVALYYRDANAETSVDRICLTTSTSEAYSFLFRLLCNPGDEVLIARPSYPLFDFIAQLDDVVLREYPLFYDPNADLQTGHGWSIDLHALEAAITPKTRAVILVHPNNPTGNFASEAEREALQTICAKHELALIVDEVFLDYSLANSPVRSFAAGDSPCLCFVLSGISKVCGLPQMKASWIVARGPGPWVNEAMGRIEVIADTFLSMNAPVQLALPMWLASRHEIQRQIRERMRSNLTVLDDFLKSQLPHSSAQRLALQGGWTAVLRTVERRGFVEAALERGVLVQPGEFYGLPAGRIVLSLLTPPDTWKKGIALLPVEVDSPE